MLPFLMASMPAVGAVSEVDIYHMMGVERDGTPFYSPTAQTYTYAQLWAFDRMQSDPGFMPGVNVTITFMNSACRPSQAVANMLSILNGDTSNVVGIVGPMCSGSAEMIATFGKITKWPNVCGTCASPSLSDKLLYPYLSRATGSIADDARALARAGDNFGWKQYSTLYCTNQYGEITFTAFYDAVTNEFSSTSTSFGFGIFTEDDDAEMQDIIAAVKSAPSKIFQVVHNAAATPGGNLVEYLLGNKIDPPTYQWIGTGGSLLDEGLTAGVVGLVHVSPFWDWEDPLFLEISQSVADNFEPWYNETWGKAAYDAKVDAGTFPYDLNNLKDFLFTGNAGSGIAFLGAMDATFKGDAQDDIFDVDKFNSNLREKYFVGPGAGGKGFYIGSNGDLVSNGALSYVDCPTSGCLLIANAQIIDVTGNIEERSPVKFANGETVAPPDVFPPYPVTSIAIAATSTEMVVSWSFGVLRGAPVSSVDIGYRLGTEAWTDETADGPATEHKLTGLEVGATYDVRVAVNTRGGASEFAETTNTMDSFLPCSDPNSGGCKASDLSECKAGTELCSCLYPEYSKPVEPIRTTKMCEYMFTPCTISECIGAYGSCRFLLTLQLSRPPQALFPP
jgi:hypothetical protein